MALSQLSRIQNVPHHDVKASFLALAWRCPGLGFTPALLGKQDRFDKIWYGSVLLLGRLLHEAENVWLEAQGEGITFDLR